MGTNYYWSEPDEICPTCNHNSGAKEIHIGKSSAGWEFMFHGTAHLKSWSAWKQFLYLNLGEGKILDEYGQQYTYTEMVACVEDRKHPKALASPFKEAVKGGYFNKGYWMDHDGYSFCEGEFS
jgi:hypothetical protein